jgi:hypothetical protein
MYAGSGIGHDTRIRGGTLWAFRASQMLAQMPCIREHVVIVRPGEHGLLAHTMFCVNEIRSESEFRTDIQSVGAEELDLAKTFLEALEVPFAERVQRRVSRRVAGDDLQEAGTGGHGGIPRTSARGEARGGHSGSAQEEHRDGSETCPGRNSAVGNTAGPKNTGESHGDQAEAAVPQGPIDWAAWVRGCPW